MEFREGHGDSPYAFGFAHPAPPLLIEAVALDDKAVVGLIGRLDGELAAMYEPEQNHFGLDPESVTLDRGVVLRATYDGVVVGCGAVRRIDEDRFEVKRMFVDASARGLKIGAALLDQLEAHARRLGARQLVLETGTRQAAALGLYAAAGFAPTPLWGEYLRSPDTSRCFAKSLSPLRS